MYTYISAVERKSASILSYAQTSILVHFIWVTLFSFLVMTFQGGGVTSCKFGKITPRLYLPIPSRTRNEGIRS